VNTAELWRRGRHIAAVTRWTRRHHGDFPRMPTSNDARRQFACIYAIPAVSSHRRLSANKVTSTSASTDHHGDTIFPRL